MPSGYTNGDSATNGISPTSAGDDYDLLFIGFGPATLSIAIALHDRNITARALILSRQPTFSWHSGMLLPGARMQISFLKDLATPRDPRSHFTFTNYLHLHGRLPTFTNLGTFFPLREEFNDYLRWCADHFSAQVRYSHDVVDVTPGGRGEGGKVESWTVRARTPTGILASFRAKSIIIAVGGRPSLPPSTPVHHPRILHSSAYCHTLGQILRDSRGGYNIAVVGGGQSAAEIFSDLHSRFPRARTSLFLRGHALRPSDDSPFVNEIFDASRVDALFSLPDALRQKVIAEDRATNYSVVRLSLLEELYTTLYAQRVRNADEAMWQHRVRPLREVSGVVDRGEKVRLRVRDIRTGEEVREEGEEEWDAVVFATGYEKDAHERLLGPMRGLMKEGQCRVGRDYRVEFKEGEVAEGADVFLQGCCEDTHGLSDSLLSILAVRAGEVADTIFGPESMMSKAAKRPSVNGASTSVGQPKANGLNGGEGV